MRFKDWLIVLSLAALAVWVFGVCYGHEIATIQRNTMDYYNGTKEMLDTLERSYNR